MMPHEELMLKRARELEFKKSCEKADEEVKERTTCQKGHPLTVENTYVYAGGLRRCRTCRIAHQLHDSIRKKELRNGKSGIS